MIKLSLSNPLTQVCLSNAIHYELFSFFPSFFFFIFLILIFRNFLYSFFFFFKRIFENFKVLGFFFLFFLWVVHLSFFCKFDFNFCNRISFSRSSEFCGVHVHCKLQVQIFSQRFMDYVKQFFEFFMLIFLFVQFLSFKQHGVSPSFSLYLMTFIVCSSEMCSTSHFSVPENFLRFRKQIF